MGTLTKSDLLEVGTTPATAPCRDPRELDRVVAVFDARVPGGRRHSRRVARLATELARSLGLERERVETIRRAAALHDIGKVEVPTEIIEKPGPLSDSEYTAVKGHSSAGAELLACLGDDTAAIVRHHHERFDGSGYPDGLAGEEIPLGARIVAVADTFDAITSARPYRPAKRRRQALALVAAEAGTQLDPRIVQVFLDRYAGVGGSWRLGPGRLALAA